MPPPCFKTFSPEAKPCSIMQYLISEFESAITKRIPCQAVAGVLVVKRIELSEVPTAVSNPRTSKT